MTSFVTNGFFKTPTINTNDVYYINKSNFSSVLGGVWTYADISGVDNVEYGQTFTYGNRPMAMNGASYFASNQPPTAQCFAMQQLLTNGNPTPSIATISQSISLPAGSYNLNFRTLYRSINSSNQSISVEISNASFKPLTGVTISGSMSGTSKIYTADSIEKWTDNIKSSVSYKSYDFTVSNSGTYNLIFKFTLTYSTARDSTIFLTDIIINSKVLPKPWGAYIAGHSKNTPSILYDITGQGRHASIVGIIDNYTNSGNGASVSIPSINGYAGTLNSTTFGSGTQIKWPAGSIPSNFTICSVTRYSGTTNQRILSSSDSNFVYGHWGGWGFSTVGTCFYNSNFIATNKLGFNTNWCVMCGTINSSVPKPNNILHLFSFKTPILYENL